MRNILTLTACLAILATTLVGEANAMPPASSGSGATNVSNTAPVVRGRCMALSTRVVSQLLSARVKSLYTAAGHTNVQAAVNLKANRTVQQPVTAANLTGVKSVEFKVNADGGATIVGDVNPISVGCVSEVTATIKVAFTPAGGLAPRKFATTTQKLMVEGAIN